jgi:hypothetical protein
VSFEEESWQYWVFDVIGAFKDGGCTRDMHQRETAFCNPFFGQGGSKTKKIQFIDSPS